LGLPAKSQAEETGIWPPREYKDAGKHMVEAAESNVLMRTGCAIAGIQLCMLGGQFVASSCLIVLKQQHVHIYCTMLADLHLAGEVTKQSQAREPDSATCADAGLK
jgi:hypothetical protein